MNPVVAIGVASIVLGCAHAAQTPIAPASPNTLSAAERAAGWRLLFDGKSFQGWRGLGYDSVPTTHWTIENGAIKKIPIGEIPRMADGQPAAGGDLMTTASSGGNGKSVARATAA